MYQHFYHFSIQKLCKYVYFFTRTRFSTTPVSPGMGIPIIKISQWRRGLIFIMGIPILRDRLGNVGYAFGIPHIAQTISFYIPRATVDWDFVSDIGLTKDNHFSPFRARYMCRIMTRGSANSCTSLIRSQLRGFFINRYCLRIMQWYRKLYQY